jgi:HlyD family secretion protein
MSRWSRLVMTVPRRLVLPSFGVVAIVALAAALLRVDAATAPGAPASSGSSTATLTRRTFVRTTRLHGVVEPVRSYSVAAPRLTGAGAGTLVVIHLAPSGAMVKAGDPLIEFDRQNQIKSALDRQADYRDRIEQMKKKAAEHDAALAHDQTELTAAEHAVRSAELDMLKNDLVSKIAAERNKQNLEEAKARLAQLQQTFALKREAAKAELRMLEIQRDRARNAMAHAQANAERMSIAAPMSGLVVARTIWKNGQMGEVQEGEEVRAGVPLLQVVDPTKMQVRARVNQADVADLRVGQTAVIRLDAYPDAAFPARLDALAPIAATSGLSPKVRSFVALFSINGTSPTLLPDLSAAVDVEVERLDDVLVAPRDAVVVADGKPAVRVAGGNGGVRPVTLGSRSDLEVVIQSGIAEGASIVRGGQ